MAQEPLRGRLNVKVQPRASRPGLTRVDEDGTVHLRLSSPPAEGRANAEAAERLAESLGVPKRAVKLVAGAASRAKTFEVEGISSQDALGRLRVLLS